MQNAITRPAKIKIRTELLEMAATDNLPWVRKSKFSSSSGKVLVRLILEAKRSLTLFIARCGITPGSTLEVSRIRSLSVNWKGTKTAV